MINNFYPPRPGENIVLMCTKCKAMFSGPNPGYGSIPIIFRPVKKAKCPKCGCKKVIPHPAVHY